MIKVTLRCIPALLLLAGLARAQEPEADVIVLTAEPTAAAPAPAAPVRPAAPAKPAAATATSPPWSGSADGCVTEEAGCPAQKYWGGFDALYGWIKNSRTPTLVTGGPGGTTVLFGGAVDNEERVGGRITLGSWFGHDQELGLEDSFLFLSTRSVSPTFGGSGAPGSPIVGRAFLNPDRAAPDARLVALPGLLAGQAGVHLSSRLKTEETVLVAALANEPSYRLELLAGFRYLELREGLGTTEDVLVLGGLPFAGERRFGFDQFDASNRFYGGEIGIRGAVCRGPWFVSGVAKLAVGGVPETVQINGSTTVLPAGGGGWVLPGSLLAQPGNIGTYHHTGFALLPEGGLFLGYQLSPHWRATFGYTFLYVSRVARPGDQVNLAVNRPGPPTIFQIKETDFWAQALSLGLELRF